MKKLILLLIIILSFIYAKASLALEPGTLLYRTSSDGKIYGKNASELIETSWASVSKINSGHVAIYIGQENGVHYVVEALASGIVKVPASYFINQAKGEVFLGAKIPKEADTWQKARVVAMAKSLADRGFRYDFDFTRQKGPLSGQWTCVGLVEKLYESANSLTPHKLTALEYDPNYYAIDITADGFDNYSIYNSRGDVFSETREFSRIKRLSKTALPAPEIFGYNAGLIYNSERYIFLPYTQFKQDSLKSVSVNINLTSSFSSDAIRGKVPTFSIILRWSLINNPVSSLKNIKNSVTNFFTNLFSSDLSEEELIILNESVNQPPISYDDTYSYSDYQAPTFSIKPIEIENESNEKLKEENNDESIKLLITMLGAEGKNNWLQIYNYGNRPIDLEAEGIRIEKTVTSASPSIVLRFDSESDVNYIGQKTILASSSYIIASQEAESEILEIADAIGLRSSFSFNQSNQTIYLANGPVRDNDDERIIDRLGYGQAKYFSGQGPAYEIKANHALRRKAKADTKLEDIVSGGAHEYLAPIYNSNDNSFDFLLWPLSNQLEPELDIIKEEEKEVIIEETEDIVEEENIIKEEVKEEEEEEEIIKEEEKEEKLTLLIVEVSAEGLDDYVVIYNYGDKDIDLEKENIRLSKSYQTANFSILSRFDSDSDAYYQGGRIISANSSYKIARNRANSEILSKADAIAYRSSFTFTGDGYTIYLSQGPINSDKDERIIDMLGFGDPLYYLGTAPAPKILDNHVLRRKAESNSSLADMLSGGRDYLKPPIYNSYNNSFDFLLLPLKVVEEEEVIEEEVIEEEIIEEEVVEEEIVEAEEEEIIEEEEVEEEDEVEEEEEVEEEIVEEEEEEEELTLYISEVSAEGLNDYIKIYNYGDKDIDLKENNIRISKAYQTPNFSIVLRFDEEVDGVFIGDRVIEANSSYMIVRDKAEDKFLNKAQAIGNRASFTWTGTGYTLYLSKGPVSSDDDERIIDKIGFGEALFYQGQGPASAILDGYALRRKPKEDAKLVDIVLGGRYANLPPLYNSKNNNLDYILWPLSNILAANYLAVLEEDYSPPGFMPFSKPETTEISDIAYLWQFNECRGSYNFDEISRFSSDPISLYNNFLWQTEGFGCYKKIEKGEDKIEIDFSNPLDANNFAISFRFKTDNEYTRIFYNLLAEDEAKDLKIDFRSYQTRFLKNVPGYSGWHSDNWLVSDDWQRFVMNFYNPNHDIGYFSIEINGEEKYGSTYSGILPEYNRFELLSDSAYIYLDDLAIWERGLSPLELENLAKASKLEPIYLENEQEEVRLKYAWLFDETFGTSTKAAVGEIDLEIENTSLVINGYRGNALRVTSSHSPFQLNFSEDLFLNDFSLSFWHKSELEYSSAKISFFDNNDIEHFGLLFGSNSAAYTFNQSNYGLSYLSEINKWNHLALVYDSFLNEIRFHVNGELVYQNYILPTPNPNQNLSYFKIFGNSSFVDIDELKIWQGALQEEQIRHEYLLIKD